MNPLAPVNPPAVLQRQTAPKDVKKCAPVVRRINELEKQYQSLSDEELQGKTEEFMERCKNGESLEDLLPRPLRWSRTAPEDYAEKPFPYAIIRLNGKWCIMTFN